jgi:competence protein ComEC
MLSVVALALWSGRNFAVSRTLLLALLIVLLLDPWAVLAVGFWLSFGAVALLFYVGSARVGSASLGEARGWRAALAQWGATQWAVTVGSLPLLLLFFQQFSLVSPLANALAIPLVSFVITPLALLFAVLPWSPLLYFDHWLMSLLMTFLEWLAHWPVWQQPAPPPWTSLLAGLGVLWLLLPRGFPSRWLGLYLILPCLVYPAPRPAVGEAWVEVLDVGQGLAVVVRTAQHALLYDTGPLYSAESDAGQRLVVPYLRATGVTQLDALLVTHADKDHSGGLIAVQDALPIALTLSSLPEQPGERCRAGDPWDWDGVRFTILHPTALDYERSSRKTNNMSCVLRVENAAGSILLTSDIEAVDEQAILARSPTLLASEVLLAPHHGSRTSSTPAFIAAVHPRDVIFPVGYRNRYGHPKSEIVERYAGSRLWRTDRDGEVRITLGNGIQLSAYRQEHRRYWHGH